MLDLTETVVQSLVLDIPNITFTVCESRKSAIERQFITEAMPLAQSTAMDIEYGVTAKPEVRLLYTVLLLCCSYNCHEEMTYSILIFSISVLTGGVHRPSFTVCLLRHLRHGRF